MQGLGAAAADLLVALMGGETPERTHLRLPDPAGPPRDDGAARRLTASPSLPVPLTAPPRALRFVPNRRFCGRQPFDLSRIGARRQLAPQRFGANRGYATLG